MSRFLNGTHFLLGLPLATVMMLAQGATPARAQALPDAAGQEVLIKASLMSFNDANVTGNYTVLHAKLAKPFRDQFSPDKLKATFKGFSEKNIDFDIIAAKQPIAEETPVIDGEGGLKLVGHFDTKPNQVKYNLDFIRSDGDWKLVGINVKLGDGNKVAEPAPAPEKNSSGKPQTK
jgi:hypothetical protein